MNQGDGSCSLSDIYMYKDHNSNRLKERRP